MQYLETTGSLSVSILPEAAVIAGARWSVDEGEWQISAAEVSGLIVGEHVVKFKETEGWFTPPPRLVFIEGGKRVSLSGVYTPKDAPPEAEFRASPTTGTVPLAVHFEDLSTGEITSWSWSFGDEEGSNPACINDEPFDLTAS